MKSKASLLLLEQLAMVLIFALTSAICMQAFVKADEISVHTRRQDRAIVLAQNAAELLKSGEAPENIPQDEEYPMEIYMQESETAGLARAEIIVRHEEEEEPLFSITVGWQEVAQ